MQRPPQPWLPAALLLLAISSSLNAAPAQADAMLQLLQERGLVPAKSKAQQVQRPQQVRDPASELVVTAMNFLDRPYANGGESISEGFDCSGFTQYVFKNTIGLVLPRRADQQAQAAALVQVQRDELKPGDLVFFNTMRRAFSHVGIYIGEGRFIHAPRTGGEVRLEDMRIGYWSKRFNGARRAEMLVNSAPTKP